MSEMIERVSAAIRRVGKVSSIDLDQDIYEAGVSSVSALELLLELENDWNVSIPDDQFIAARTPRALALMIEGLQKETVQ